MWNCNQCNTENQGLFCSNCGAPMTEEGERLELTPIAGEAQEPVAEIRPTFKDVLTQAVMSKQYLVVTILFTVGFAINTILGEGFNVITMLLMIGLYLVRAAAKDGFSKGNKSFSLPSVSVNICAVVAIIGAVSMLLVGVMLTGLNALYSDVMDESIITAFEYRNGRFTADEMNRPEVIEAFGSLSDTLGVNLEDMGGLIAENMEILIAAMWVVIVFFVGYCVIAAIVNFKISGMLKSYDAKVLDDAEPLKYSNFAVTLVQINGILAILGGVLSFDIFILLGSGTIGAAYFFFAKMMKNLNRAANNL